VDIFGKVNRLVRAVFTRQSSAPSIDQDTSAVYFDGAGNPKVVIDSANVESVHHLAKSQSGGNSITFTTTGATTVDIPTTGKLVTEAGTATLTNKTFNANDTGNSLSNVEVADFATGVVDTDLSTVSASDDTLPSAKATKAYADTKVAGLGTVTDNRVPKTNGTTGTSLEQSGVSIDDSDNVTGVTQLTAATVKATTSVILEDPGAGTNIATIQAPTLAGDIVLTTPASTGTLATEGFANSAVSTHSGLTTGVHGVGAGAVVGTTLTQTLTNKKLDGGTASADNSWLIPQKNSETGPDAATGSIFLDTTVNKVKAYYNSKWNVIGGGLIPTRVTSNTSMTAGKLYVVDMESASADIEMTLPTMAAEDQLIVLAVNNADLTHRVVIKGGTQTIWYNHTSGNDLRVVDSETWVGVVGVQNGGNVDIHAYDAKVPLNGTFAGNFTVSGILKTDTLQEYTSTEGVAVQRSTEGVSASSGYLGQLFGTERAGTGGKTYSTQSSGSLGTSYVYLVRLALNKGNYLISASCNGFNDSGGANTMKTRVYVGGTAVSQEFTSNGADNNRWFCTTSFSFPVDITADSTEVAIYGKADGATATAGNYEMWAIRI
jgi:hypothetical protein